LSEWTLNLGDCLAEGGLASLPDGAVAHTICDPPFASEIYERCKKNPGRSNGSGRGRRANNTYSVGLKALTEGAIGTLDDVLGPVAEQIARVTQRWALVFSDVESVHLWRAALEQEEMQHVRVGAWTKEDPMPQFSGDRPAQGFEVCEIAHAASRPRWNGGGKAALWHHAIAKGGDRPDHPCPKPLSLMEELIADFTDPGELVCDPFAGSGTTGVACIRLGRRFIGWEKDPSYYETARKRLGAARQQYELLPRGPKPRQSKLGLSDPEEAA
jgi:hypothetical protein